jgi:hypothetical protein
LVQSDFAARGAPAETRFWLPMYPVSGTRPTQSSDPPGLQATELFAATGIGVAEFKACIILRG